MTTTSPSTSARRARTHFIGWSIVGALWLAFMIACNVIGGYVSIFIFSVVSAFVTFIGSAIVLGFWFSRRRMSRHTPGGAA